MQSTERALLVKSYSPLEQIISIFSRQRAMLYNKFFKHLSAKFFRAFEEEHLLPHLLDVHANGRWQQRNVSARRKHVWTLNQTFETQSATLLVLSCSAALF